MVCSYWILIVSAVLCPLLWLGTPKDFWVRSFGVRALLVYLRYCEYNLLFEEYTYIYVNWSSPLDVGICGRSSDRYCSHPRHYSGWRGRQTHRVKADPGRLFRILPGIRNNGVCFWR